MDNTPSREQPGTDHLVPGSGRTSPGSHRAWLRQLGPSGLLSTSGLATNVRSTQHGRLSVGGRLRIRTHWSVRTGACLTGCPATSATALPRQPRPATRRDSAMLMLLMLVKRLGASRVTHGRGRRLGGFLVRGWRWWPAIASGASRLYPVVEDAARYGGRIAFTVRAKKKVRVERSDGLCAPTAPRGAPSSASHSCVGASSPPKLGDRRSLGERGGMVAAADIIRTKTVDFVGRDYVFTAVETFLEDHDRGFLVLEGDPGAGTTAILAEYIRRTHCVGHSHCATSPRSTTSPSAWRTRRHPPREVPIRTCQAICLNQTPSK